MTDHVGGTYANHHPHVQMSKFCTGYSDETWYVGSSCYKESVVNECACLIPRAYLFWLANNKISKYQVLSL